MAAGGEGGPAGLAAQGLDALALAMRAIADERVNRGVRDAVVRAGAVWTSEAVGRDTFGCASPALEFTPGTRRRERGWSGWGQGCLSAAGRTIVGCAWFEQALDGDRWCVALRLTATLPQNDQPECTEHQWDEPWIDVSCHRSSFDQAVRERRPNYPPQTEGAPVAAIVCDTLPVPAILEALHDASLLHIQASAHATRFLMLLTIGEFALEMLTANGERERAQQRHLAYFVQFADRAYTELLGPNQAHCSAQIAAEHDNFRAALRWALSHNQIEAALHIATGIWRFWWQRGFLREGSDWLETALAQHETASPEITTKALRAAGVLAMGLSDYPRARQRLEQALEIGLQIGAIYDYAASLTNLGLVLREQGDFDGACTYLEQSIAVNRTTADPRSVKFPMIILAELYGRQGNIDRAGALYEACLQLNRELGDAEGTANALYGIAWVVHARADCGRARHWCEDALALYQTLNHQFGLGWCYSLLGDIVRDNADSAAVLAQYRHSLTIWMKREDRVSAAQTLDKIAKVMHQLSHTGRAVRLMGAAHAIRKGTDATLTANEKAAHDRVLMCCRAALGEKLYQGAWDEGRRLRLKQAATLAWLDSEEPDQLHSLSGVSV